MRYAMKMSTLIIVVQLKMNGYTAQNKHVSDFYTNMGIYYYIEVGSL